MSVAVRKEQFEDHPILDAAKLQSIKDLADGDDEFFSELTDLFFERAPLLLGEMQSSLSEADAGKFERSSHALKGTSGNLGAMKMMKICEELETMGRNNSLDGAQDLLDELQQIYPLTEKELKDHWL
ncbi:Hpt domain-containing protein [Pseudobacteriovorax antillogorgiicola]|uniref:HPt (Histidine-containing phosphotransfer) domain-containing protein n=1 Tax=Pseudobacteriovorax antillogorgiicola TaxID=1513793 RepID=A0A1Y6C6V0_9BACT|nr:Hpt domain-containing protein [Pseudobacteriovorax antillogorgiicola]TCS49406.1 HPt (histidine-containing phosphotransfer) domain-containing protein [Pseudobacteriovorax antillogorgiicola]SMF47007.1 HPt (histidine-containing phosphotransfer) domain-containing protein [Pseudobacteriovorax antillogorgiicola]